MGKPAFIYRTERGDEYARRVAAGESATDVAKAFGVKHPAVLKACALRGVFVLTSKRRAAMAAD